MLDDTLRQPGTDARHSRQKRRGGGVGVDTDSIHAVLDDGIERACKFALAEVMLILPDPNRLRVNLDQLSQWILQSPRD